ncbi:MAG: protein kinase [Sandaracinaceae bacterium]|nr:protein kinase [Sandaracinaceae bacterium]
MAELSGTDARTSLSFGPTLPYPMGRFTLCEEIGAGGMATVYLAKMRLAAGLERHVAIKTIHSHLAKQQAFVDMFLDEAKIASHISHPNVCAVYDFGDVSGLYYIAMEYLVGAPLIEVVNAIAEAGDDSLLETVPYLAARIIADAAEGLHAAHTLRGGDGKPLHVIHRDVSPQNLFVTHEGSVKVVDFGCAKALERVTQTNTGVLKGKVAYAAPEQLRGENVDARVDVFALGVCLWECLTLRNLFRRDNAILTAQAVLNDAIPLANEGAEWVPKPLAAIAAKALARDPSQRFESAREMGRALRGFIAGSGVTFESAEVAEVMQRLFGERQSETLDRLARLDQVTVSQVGPVTAEPVAVEVVTGPSAPVDTVPPPGRGKTKKSKRERALENAATKLDKSPSKSEPNAWELSEAEEDPVVLPTRTGRYAAAVAVLLAVIAGGAYAYLEHRAPIFAALGIAQDHTDTSATNTTDTSATNTTDTSAADTSAADTSAADTSAADTSAADTSATDTSATDTGREAVAAGDPSEPETPPTGEPETGTRTPELAGAAGETDHGTSRRRGRRDEPPVTTTSAGGTTTAPPATAAGSPESLVQPSRTIDFSRGVVNVRTAVGWAYVEHQGQRLGRTPLRVELPAGRQTLRILPYGRTAPVFTRMVDVAWGNPQTVTVEWSSTEGLDNPY